MYKVYKNKNYKNKIGVQKGWEFFASFGTFEEAKKFAEQNICKDLWHEGSASRVYWFTDSNGADEGYMACIDSIGVIDNVQK